MEKIASETRAYELSFLIDSTLGEEGAASFFEELTSQISKNGKLLHAETPYLRNLAYAISVGGRGRKQWFETAYFGWFIFESAPEDFTPLTEKIFKDERIIRFLAVTLTKDAVAHMEKRKLGRTDEVRNGAEEGMIDEIPVPEGTGRVSEEELEKKLKEIAIQ